MKYLVLAAVAAALIVTVSASAGGTPNLKTFGTGHVFVNGNECATFNGAGEYGGCYRNKTTRKALADLHISFVSGADVGGGAPRFSIPIDENGDRITDAYAFIDVNNCGQNLVSTDELSCQVFLNTGGQWANWHLFADAPVHHGWTIGSKAEVGVKPNGKPDYDKDMPFIIADVQGNYLVTGVSLNY